MPATYQNVLPIARQLAHTTLEPYSREYIEMWNDFEDYLKGKISLSEADAILKAAHAEERDIMAAAVIVCMIG